MKRIENGNSVLSRLTARLRSALRQEAALLVVVTAAAAILRLLLLGKESLWYDETFSARGAQLGWTALAKVTITADPADTFYYVLLHGWVLVFGTGESALRMLSVLFSVATVPIIYALGTRLCSSRVGMVAASLLAVHAVDIQYAQEARSYSLAIFLLAASSLYFVRIIDLPGLGNCFGYALASVLAVYAHFFALLVLLAQWVSLPFFRPQRAARRRLVASGLVAVLLLTPAPLPIFAGVTGGAWAWIPRTSVRSVEGVFYALAGALPGLSPTTANLLLLLYSIAVLVAFLALARAWLGASGSAASYGFLAAWFCVPIGLALAASLVKPMVIDRYFLVCLPAFLLLAAAGICSVRSPWLLAAALVPFVCLGLLEDVDYYRYFHKEDWRGAIRYVLSEIRQDDALVLSPSSAVPFEYYHGRFGAPPGYTLTVFPEWDVSREPGTRPEGKSAEALHRWLDGVSQHKRAWLIMRAWHTPSNDEAWVDAQVLVWSRYQSADRKVFQGVMVFLFSSPTDVRKNSATLMQRAP